MSNILRDITAKAVKLPRHQRLVLAGFLLDLDDSDEFEVDQEWEKEIKSRIQAFDAGLIEADSYEEVQRKMKKRFAQ
jgi:Putative addiction module component